MNRQAGVWGVFPMLSLKADRIGGKKKEGGGAFGPPVMHECDQGKGGRKAAVILEGVARFLTAAFCRGIASTAAACAIANSKL